MPEAAPPAVSLPRSFPPNSVQFAQMVNQMASMLRGAFTIAVGQLSAGGSMMIPIGSLGASPSSRR